MADTMLSAGSDMQPRTTKRTSLAAMQTIAVATWHVEQLRAVVAAKQRALAQHFVPVATGEAAIQRREEAVIDLDLAEADLVAASAKLQALQAQVHVRDMLHCLLLRALSLVLRTSYLVLPEVSVLQAAMSCTSEHAVVTPASLPCT